MNKIIGYILVWALALFLSCSDEQKGIPNEPPEVQGKTITLTFTSRPLQENGTETRVVGESIDLIMGEKPDASTRIIPADEAIIDNVCIFQFEGSKDNSSNAILRAKFYLNKMTGNTQSITLASTSGSCFLYVYANVGDLTNNYTVGSSTFSAIKDASLKPSGQEGDGLLPMSGCADVDYTGSVSVSLTRMFAKVTFTCDLSALPSGNTFKITGATLRNVSRSVTYYPSAENAAILSMIDVNSLTGTPVVNGNKTTYTWYIPENLRGAGKYSLSSGEWKKRIERNAPNYATYIELVGDYTVSGSTETFTYVIYLGNGDINNYDVQRNHSYQITARIKGKNIKSDLRVNDYTNLSADGLANCYLASKDNYKYCFNGTVRGNGNTDDYAALQYPGIGISLMPDKVVSSAPDAVTIPFDQIKEAVLMWETPAGVISELQWDATLGYIKFKTGTVKGNALIAVRNASGTVLWSWHIWRTNGVGLKELNEKYSVEMKAYDGRTIYVMDRSIGVNFDHIPPTYDDCIGANALFYQFGRKDPFPRTYSLTTGLQRKFESIESPGTAALKQSVTAPNIFYAGTTAPFNWISTATLNTNDWKISNCLWGDNSNGDGIIDTNPWDGRKTIYDPSPVGWRVAPADVWTGVFKSGYSHDYLISLKQTNHIDDVNISDFSMGYTVYSNVNSRPIYLPASGYYHHGLNNTGTWENVRGYGWMSSPGGINSVQSIYLSLVSGTIYTAYVANRAFGLPVRCVQE